MQSMNSRDVVIYSLNMGNEEQRERVRLVDTNEMGVLFDSENVRRFYPWHRVYCIEVSA